jgi:hypothetical protein
MSVPMPRILAAVLVAFVFAFGTVPAWSVEQATPDDTAKFLAGMPTSPDSPLTPLTKDPAWQQHARYLDSIFAREEKAHLSEVRAFSKEYLTDKHDTMFYMFSGPDFLYANSFFPSASTYILAGLEPPGEVPQLMSLSRPVVFATLRNLETSMATLLSYSFFITAKMQSQLRAGPVYGTTPVLLVFMARTGKTVHEISLVTIDEQGNLQAANDAATASANADGGKKGAKPAHTTSRGVKIVFSDGSGPKQTLYYFSTDLSNGGFERSGFSAFLSKYGPADSFVKSASYLLHGGNFSSVRNLLLDRSATILEDDSGVPLASFDRKKWKLQPFGSYVGPLSIFRYAYQPGMSELYRQAKPLDFGIGYRWRKNESNLLLAQKNAAATSDDQLTPPLPADHNPPAAAATGSPTKKLRKRAYATGSFGCRSGGVFPFCSAPPPRASR